MKKVKSIQYTAPGKPIFIDVEMEGPGEKQVGIEIIASSLCNTSELRSFKGGYETGYGVSYPMKDGEPGHEAVGRVISLGSGAKGFAKGDYVAMTGHGGEPCHREYVNRCCKDIAVVLPKKRDISEAAALEMYGCAYHCAMTPLSTEDYSGKRVLVLGMGAMGLCTVQILNNFNLSELVAADLFEVRLKIAEKSGADKAVRPSEISASEKFDIIIECSGSVPGQEMACALAPEVLIFSSYNTKGITINQNLWFDAHTTIYNPGIVTSENFKKVADLYNKEMINPSLLIGKRIKPDKNEYLEAISEIKDGKVVKVLMEWK
ncbi:MAG: alcohol dehydrogenase catalytic domain-containing protein [Clostridiales bacterium]|nr:alcohol dehydrogenase catalytic domain-containing protein [Clostridiales bacterium]